MIKNRKFQLVVAILAITLVLVACGGNNQDAFQKALSACPYGVASSNAVTGEVVCIEAPVACCDSNPEAEVTNEAVNIDNLGPEQAFPGSVEGPAIAEVWDGASYCALVKINIGETVDWNGPGAWWQAANQGSLDVRFPHHRQEFEAKSGNPKCEVLLSADNLP